MRVLFSLLMLLAVAGVSAQTVFDPATTSSGWKVVNNVNLNPPVTVTAGTTYTFDISQVSPGSHPFLFSTSSTNTGNPVNNAPIAENGPLYKVWSSAGCTNGTTTGESTKFSTTGGSGTNATPLNTCVVSLWANTTAVGNTIYYRCSNHVGMVGTITIAAAPGATTSPPTGAGTTSPTTPAPKGAAAVVGAGMSFVVAVMTALFA